MTSEHPVLKPCPFCGSSNVAPALIGYHRVGYCKNCGAKGPHRDSPTPVEAIAAWNTRPTPSPDVADVSDQLRKEAAMLREIAKSEARGVDWRENLGASAEWLTQAAATITALSAELARKDKALEEAREGLERIARIDTRKHGIGTAYGPCALAARATLAKLGERNG